MFTWNRLLIRLRLKPDSGTRYFKLDKNLRLALVDLADQEQRPAEELQADLLATAVAQRYTHNELWQRWESLSPRERDVTAFTCLGYTNRQIAARLRLALGISWHDFLTPDFIPLVEIGNHPLGIIVRITDTVAPVANTVVLAEGLLPVGTLEICA